MSIYAKSDRDARVTLAQALWLLRHAERDEVVAASFGLGSNGYPPGEDGWILLADGQSVWLTPEGDERRAG